MLRFFALLLLPLAAVAEPIVLSWQNATTNSDGSAIPASGSGSIATTRFEYGTCGGAGTFGTKLGEVAVPGVILSIEFEFGAGTYCFRGKHVNTLGAESVFSVVVSKTITAPPPPPPTVVTVSKLVYDLTISGSIGRIVGRIPLGTPCIGEVWRTWANGTKFYEVPRSAVTLTRTPRSTKLVGKCAAA